MRTALAEKLLVKVMDWDTEEISRERPLIQALANLKYDEYQNYSSGSRFIESLAKWLGQFEESNEKKIAYKFIKEHLIFISSEQISHLVSITFSDKINPVLIEKTASKLAINPYFVNKIINTKEYEETLRRCLFIGLSDGSKIDQLRRNSGLNNEQCLQTYAISEAKVSEMIDELNNSGYSGKFNSIFLIDDFTASGTSYFRYDEKSQKWKGKIYKTISSIINLSESSTSNGNENLYRLITDQENIKIHIIFYIATEEAITRLKENIDTWRETVKPNFEYDIEVIQLITNEIKEQILSEADFLKISEKYFDKKIMDRHYTKGKHDYPYLGFNECSLPLILSHNTPNNSLPILWFPEDMKITGLFHRVSRHKE